MPSLAQRLRQLPTVPPDAALQPFVDEIVNACRTKRLPLTSASAYLRHAETALKQPAHARLKALVEAEMRAGEGATQAATLQTTFYCSSAEAALLLGLNQRTLNERLKRLMWRRFYGWAFFDGHQWQVPRAALDPLTRAMYLNAQPDDEPRAHVDLLLDGCERAPQRLVRPQQVVSRDVLDASEPRAERLDNVGRRTEPRLDAVPTDPCAAP